MKRFLPACAFLALASLLLHAETPAQRNLNAIQMIYRHGVPQIDKRGRPLDKYDPQKSFFPIGLWGSPVPDGANNYSWDQLRKLHYNTVWPWNRPPKIALAAGKKYGVQIITMSEMSDDDLKAVANNDNLLANVWADEPIGHLLDPKNGVDKAFHDYVSYREKAKRLAPDMPVFVNDAPWITPPATAWWVKWNSVASISCNDCYPIMVSSDVPTGFPNSIAPAPNGIPQVVDLTVASDLESKPVWLIVGVFDQKPKVGDSFPFRYPTPVQLRAQVYAAIIHGATGIHYFIYDSFVSRAANVIGMSPNPLPTYPPKNEGAATEMEMVNARALWDAAGRINGEISSLVPSILSPTVGNEVDYKVSITGNSPYDSPIRCLLKPDLKGGYYLFSVNLDNSVLETTWTFPDELTHVERMFENQPPENLGPTKREFSVQFEPFDTHVFHITPATKVASGH